MQFHFLQIFISFVKSVQLPNRTIGAAQIAAMILPESCIVFKNSPTYVVVIYNICPIYVGKTCLDEIGIYVFFII